MKPTGYQIIAFIVVCLNNGVLAQDWSWLENEIVIPLDEEFYGPTSMAFDALDNLYLPDPKAGKIVKIAPDGQMLFYFARKGQGPGEMDYAYDVVVNPEKQILWALDYFTGKLFCFDLEGAYLFHKTYNMGLKSMVYKEDGSLIVSVSSLKKSLVVLNPDGEIVSWFGRPLNEPLTLKDFEHTLKFLHLDDQDRLYAANLRSPLISCYSKNLDLIWETERVWTNQAIEPTPLMVHEGVIKSSHFHLSLFSKDGVLYVGTGYEEEAILAFDTDTGAYLGFRRMGYRPKHMKLYKGNIYVLESEDALLHIYPLGHGPVYEKIYKGADYGERFLLKGKSHPQPDKT